MLWRDLPFEVLAETGAHFVDLGNGDREAIPLRRVFGEEVLVILLGRIERRRLFQRGDYFPVPESGSTRARRFERLFLCGGRREHRRTVLRTNVVALTIQLARIMHGEEGIENDGTRNHLGIKSDRNGLGVQ